MRQARLTYLAQTQPGFEAIAANELTARLDDVTLRGTRAVADKNSMLLFGSGLTALGSLVRRKLS